MYQIVIRMKDTIGEKMKHISEQQKRSLNQQINLIVEQHIKDYEKVNGEIKIEK